MRKEYLRVILDLSNGSAYEYSSTSDVPTKIEYGRQFSGKFQKGIVEGCFSNIKVHDICFLIKRGADLNDIQVQAKTNY